MPGETNSRLTARELEVFDGISHGETTHELSKRLGISSRTVEIHRLHLLEKTGAKNTPDLVRRVYSSRSYHHRAQEARSKAETMRDQLARDIMLRIADDYDRLDEIAEKRESQNRRM